MKTEKPEKVGAPWDLQGSPQAVADALAADCARARGLESLRDKFPAESIGKLPRATRQDAKPGRCNECGGWHKLPAVHLDYVGHAEVTDRLLSVDPEWNWRPMAKDERGLPMFDRGAGGNPVGLWIELTVLGMTRLGYGSVDGHAFDAEKQLIGDAIRNAAMRFGVALQLWSKAELESSLEVNGEAVDKKTGEVIPPTSRDEGERMAAEIVAWGTTPATPRIIEGIPIRCAKDWQAVSTWPLGGESRYAKMPLGKIIDQDGTDEHDALDYFERTAVRAVLDLWNRMVPNKKAKGLGLQCECVLIAYDELMKRRSPPPSALFPMGGSDES
jgi:hypothetical protein